MAKWKVAGINFDHFHMGDLLREAFNHPDAEIVGICDAQPERMQGAIEISASPPTASTPIRKNASPRRSPTSSSSARRRQSMRSGSSASLRPASTS